MFNEPCRMLNVMTSFQVLTSVFLRHFPVACPKYCTIFCKYLWELPQSALPMMSFITLILIQKDHRTIDINWSSWNWQSLISSHLRIIGSMEIFFFKYVAFSKHHIMICMAVNGLLILFFGNGFIEYKRLEKNTSSPKSKLFIWRIRNCLCEKERECDL